MSIKENRSSQRRTITPSGIQSLYWRKRIIIQYKFLFSFSQIFNYTYSFDNCHQNFKFLRVINKDSKRIKSLILTLYHLLIIVWLFIELNERHTEKLRRHWIILNRKRNLIKITLIIEEKIYNLPWIQIRFLSKTRNPVLWFGSVGPIEIRNSSKYVDYGYKTSGSSSTKLVVEDGTRITGFNLRTRNGVRKVEVTVMIKTNLTGDLSVEVGRF